jgi:hypothetical protein
MGWTNSHLHAFEKDSISYGDSANDDFDSMDTIPEQRVTVNSLLRFEGEMMVYLYDFGDDWRHDVALEKILPAGPVPTRPVCLAGEFHCPPEDVGGVPGYEKFVDVILEPTHEDYRRLLKWSGGSFEAAEFDILAVNDALSKLRYTVQGPSM